MNKVPLSVFLSMALRWSIGLWPCSLVPCSLVGGIAAWNAGISKGPVDLIDRWMACISYRARILHSSEYLLRTTLDLPRGQGKSKSFRLFEHGRIASTFRYLSSQPTQLTLQGFRNTLKRSDLRPYGKQPAGGSDG